MAKKFNFKLDPLLRLRGYKVGEAKNSLYRTLKMRFDKEKQIEDTEAYYNSLMKVEIKSVKASSLQAEWHHKKYTNDKINKLHKEKQQITEIENLQRRKLNLVMKEEKILQKLKEKQIETHRQEINCEDNKILDEIGISGFIKK